MTKNDKKHMVLTDEDMKIIQSDPSGLADYIVRSKIRETKKTALIVVIIAMVLAFTGGAMCGMTWTKTSIPNNVVTIQVGDNSVEPAVENTELEK